MQHDQDSPDSNHLTDFAPPIERPPVPNAPPAPPPPAPVSEHQRISAIDALRGFALLGILVLNIQVFAMPGAAYINPTAYGDFTGANFWTWYLSHLLCDQKIMTIFSMLFGAGIVLMSSRIESTGNSALGVHYRRMGWLILFGILHAYLIWYGDILVAYGMCGLVAWWFRKLRPTWLIMFGTISFIIPVLFSLAFGYSMSVWPEEAIADMQTDWQPGPELLQTEIAAYQGNWLEQMPQRAPTALFFQTFLFIIWSAWRAGGLMLIGMALFKMGFFSAQRTSRTYLIMLAIGLLIGIPITLYGISRNIAEGWRAEYSFFIGSQYNYVASVIVSLGWVGGFMWLIKHGLATWLMRGLEAVGRMAFTNYIMQSVVCTFIFYGHGLGYFGQLERLQMFGVVALVWALELIWSPIWLRYFRFGPLEWLWRTLTYWKRQPMRR